MAASCRKLVTFFGTRYSLLDCHASKFQINWSQTHCVPLRRLHGRSHVLLTTGSTHRRYHPAALLSTTMHVRNESTTAATVQPETLPDGYIPGLPDLPDPAMDMTSLGEPTLASLGLCNYTPAGLVQWGLEHLHVGLDVPWWGAIVIGTAFLRLCVFPVAVISRKNAVRMANNGPTLQRLQRRISKATRSNDQLEAMRASAELQSFQQRNGLSPFKLLSVPMAQVPIFISVFVGLRGMANLPVESMVHGGTLWFTDLTVADPFYLLPLITASTLLCVIEFGSDGTQASMMTPLMKWVMRGLPFVFVPFMCNFPTALCVYWCTTNAMSLLVALFLKQKPVSRWFGIEERIVHPKEVGKKSEGLMDTIRQTKNDAQARRKKTLDIEKYDYTRFRTAGQGAIPKTYKADPERVRSAKYRT